MIPPTRRRTLGDDGHFPPATGVDKAGRPWRGTSRIVDPGARRRHNRRTWQALKAEARRAYLESLEALA